MPTQRREMEMTNRQRQALTNLIFLARAEAKVVVTRAARSPSVQRRHALRIAENYVADADELASLLEPTAPVAA